MLPRNLVEAPIETALKQRECIFNGIRVNVPDSVGARVNDHLVPAREFALKRENVYRMFVGPSGGILW